MRAALPPRAVGSVRAIVRGFWTVPVAAAAVGWTLREAVPFGASPGSYVASLLGIVAPTSLTFPCWLHGTGLLRRGRARARRAAADPPPA